MKILYNVTIIIDHSVHDEWKAWMKEVHIPAVMATGHFIENKMMRILEDEHNPDGVTYAVHYVAPSIQAYEDYQNNCAPALQAETIKKYNGLFAAFRTCMEIVE
jgi:hypothetical protein